MEYAIAFIGYGEAAYHISRGLQSEKRVRMIAYDEMAEDAARGAKICSHMEEVGVVRAASAEEAFTNAKYIVSLTSAASAIPVAQGIIGKLKAGQVYVDMNSAALFL